MTEPWEFLVQGSSPEPYSVRIRKIGGKVFATCTCKAAINGQLCKHRIRIMHGDSQNVVSENLEEVRNMPSYLAGTIVPTACKEISRLEKEVDEVKRALAQAKQSLAEALSVSMYVRQ